MGVMLGVDLHMQNERTAATEDEDVLLHSHGTDLCQGTPLDVSGPCHENLPAMRAHPHAAPHLTISTTRYRCEGVPTP